jgi:pimeloyl-ACP methyl ester carboxylesterase
MAGFPDSFLLWRHILQSPDLHRNNVLIAVDLPGYGGSDGLSFYGPYEMLEAMTEFILDMRKQYLQVDKRLVVVTHDWGALTGSRLASEAGELADRWIITSGIIVGLLLSWWLKNANARIATLDGIKCHCPVGFGYADASYLDWLAYQSSPFENCLYCPQSCSISIPPLLLHLLLPSAISFQRILCDIWQLLVPASDAQSRQRQAAHG